MMDRDKFQMQVGRLSSRWPKAHPPEFVTLLWREVKELSDAWFVRTVDDLIGSCRQAPLIPDFREHISIERERTWNQQKHVAPGIDWNRFASCDTCWDNGVYLCVRRGAERDGFYAFRCHCSKGFSDPRKMIPQFKADHAKEFDWFDARRLTEMRMREQA